MGTGYQINCNKCTFTKSLEVGFGMLHSSVEAWILSTTMKEQQKIKKILSDNKNGKVDCKGYSVFQCSKCYAIANKFHLAISENKKILFETNPVCRRCKIKMKLLPCDEDKNTINDIKCPKCRSDDIFISAGMMWD